MIKMTNIQLFLHPTDLTQILATLDKDLAGLFLLISTSGIKTYMF